MKFFLEVWQQDKKTGELVKMVGVVSCNSKNCSSYYYPAVMRIMDSNPLPAGQQWLFRKQEKTKNEENNLKTRNA